MHNSQGRQVLGNVQWFKLDMEIIKALNKKNFGEAMEAQAKLE